MELSANILVAQSLTSRECGQQLIHLLTQYFPLHIPERFGTAEPPRRRFRADNIDEALDMWGHVSFTAERSQPHLLLHVLFCPATARRVRHSSISVLGFQSDREGDENEFCEFVNEVCDSFAADYAVAHILTRAELMERLAGIRQQTKRAGLFRARLSEKLENRTGSHGYALLLRHEEVGDGKSMAEHPLSNEELATRQAERLSRRIEREGFARVLCDITLQETHSVHIRKRLRELYWVNVFGRPYVELLGREKLLGAGVHQSLELPYGGISLKLTRTLQDEQKCWENFKGVRDRCKVHLDNKAFFNPKAPLGEVYNVPQFKFGTGE